MTIVMNDERRDKCFGSTLPPVKPSSFDDQQPRAPRLPRVGSRVDNWGEFTDDEVKDRERTPPVAPPAADKAESNTHTKHRRKHRDKSRDRQSGKDRDHRDREEDKSRVGGNLPSLPPAGNRKKNTQRKRAHAHNTRTKNHRTERTALRGLSDSECELDIAGLQRRFMEMEGLLRIPFNKDGDVDRARTFVSRSQVFLTKLAELSQQMGLLQGTIFQDLLARLSRANDGSQNMDLRSSRLSMREPLDEVPPDQANKLMTQANELLNLVRIKIEDDNDLKLVRQALRESALFFKDLRTYNRYHSSTQGKRVCELDLLEQLRYMDVP